jgi:hypothetical protein
MEPVWSDAKKQCNEESTTDNIASYVELRPASKWSGM